MTNKELVECRMIIATGLRKRRYDLKLSAREIAEKSGLTMTTIYKIEQGRPCALDTLIIYDFTLKQLNK